MRDLLFKNLTSRDRRKKIIASSEVVEREGVRSVIHRHFLCLIREVAKEKESDCRPSLYITKEHNRKEQRERFFCKIKGSMYVDYEGRFYQVFYLHSLHVNLVQQNFNVAT